jgi:hypothetical protein
VYGRHAGTDLLSRRHIPRHLFLNLVSVSEAATPAQSLLSSMCEIWGSDAAAV